MKTSSEFRRSGYRALDGKWGKGVLAGIIASALGGVASIAPSFDYKIDDLPTEPAAPSAELIPVIIGLAVTIFIVAFAFGIVVALVGEIVRVGYSKFNLDLIDGREPSIADMFRAFPDWKRVVKAALLVLVRVLPWFLLFIIPGIVKAYSYFAVPYILAEDDSITPREALDKSMELMQGNRLRLFYLQLSFIGWVLLSILTLGILGLWLTPYQMVTFADFYREISGTRPTPGTDADGDIFDTAFGNFT